MIISVSRRTDIPAFYNEWFFNRINEGYVYVKNPFNRKQISKIELTKENVECFVFWTKDATNMINNLDKIKEYNYYFQWTITSYRKDIEKGNRSKKEIINSFKEISNKIGKEKMIWRYDPILLNEYYTKEYHYEWFEKFCKELSGYTERCIISFIDIYHKIKKSSKEIEIEPISYEDMIDIASEFSIISKKYNIEIQTCSEKIDLQSFGISHGKCIDNKLIEMILGKNVICKKDKNQREECGCIKSVDIGEYDTCLHGCSYCYANRSESVVIKNRNIHNPKSPILIGELIGDEKITVRKNESIVDSKNENQISFL